MRLSPATRIEVLVPDFRGRDDRALGILREAPPDVMNHNLETIPRLYKEARPGSDYQFSLNLLKKFKQQVPGVPTKSGLMVGLGETDDEILQTMRDMRAHDIDMLTIGQYLAPSGHHLPVRRYVHPDTFKMFEREAQAMGFTHAAVGAMVRSSYHADQQAHAAGVPDAVISTRVMLARLMWRHQPPVVCSSTSLNTTWPGLFCSSTTRPPCCSITRRTRNSPRPWPLLPLLRTPRSNRRGTRSASMPGPHQ